MSKRVGIYLRVSTAEQTTENQRLELFGTAERNAWNVVRVFEDAGISGAKGRDDRPGLDALLKAVTRKEIDVVAAWSVDRLGRSLAHLVDLLKTLQSKNVDLFLHQQGLDTTTPSGRAMFGMLGVFSEFERALIRERVMAGLTRARASGIKLGRPSIEQAKAIEIKTLLAQGNGVRKIARTLHVGVGTVLKVRDQNTTAVA